MEPENNTPDGTQTPNSDAPEGSQVPENSIPDGNPAPDWRESFSDDIKGNESIKGFKTTEDLAKSYVNLQGLMGKKVSELSKEQVADFLGKDKPLDSPEQYNTEGLAEDAVERFSKQFHNLGLSEGQANGIKEEYLKYMEEVSEGMQKEADIAADAEIEAMKKEFGSAYESKIEIAKRAVLKFGDDTLFDKIAETGLGRSPDFVKMLSNIGSKLSENSLVDEDTNGKVYGVTSPEDAKNKISELYGNTEFMQRYGSPNKLVREPARAEMEKYFKIAHPK